MPKPKRVLEEEDPARGGAPFDAAVATLVERFEGKSQAALDRATALDAAAAIAKMQPDMLENLAACVELMKEARKQADSEAFAEAVLAIRELFESPQPHDGLAHEEVLESIVGAEEAQSANSALKAEQDQFRSRYFQLKDECGFVTQREVADAADLSLTAVNSIERGEVKLPQWKTLDKLARGFSKRLKRPISAAYLRGIE